MAENGLIEQEGRHYHVWIDGTLRFTSSSFRRAYRFALSYIRDPARLEIHKQKRALKERPFLPMLER